MRRVWAAAATALLAGLLVVPLAVSLPGCAWRRPPASGPAVSPVGRALAVMVDNYPDARPQTGLGEADIVYEAYVEYNLTRFMAVYLSRDPAAVGPVRSLRPYFIDWALDWRAVIAHSGFSPQAGIDLAELEVPSLDEIYRAPAAYHRAADRERPHNLYTSGAALRREAARLGYPLGAEQVPAPLFRFSERAPGGFPAPEATIVYSVYPRYFDYLVTWTWDEAGRRYLRGVNGRPWLDAKTGEQLAATTVIIQFIPRTDMREDDRGRQEMATVGRGEIWVLAGGRMRKGTWERESRRGPTRYREANGDPLTLQPGLIWVQVVDDPGIVGVRMGR